MDLEVLYARELAIACISYGNSVRLSVLVSRLDTVSKPVEIETSAFHHPYDSLVSLVFHATGLKGSP